MTLTKQSTNYTVVDTVNSVEISGNVQVYESGSINIDISTSNGVHANYHKDNDNGENLNVFYQNVEGAVDMCQSIIDSILAELAD